MWRHVVGQNSQVAQPHTVSGSVAAAELGNKLIRDSGLAKHRPVCSSRDRDVSVHLLCTQTRRHLESVRTIMMSGAF